MITRIKTSQETPTGNLTDPQVKLMREINSKPTFNQKEKQWTLVKIPKTTTRNVLWHIRIEEEHFQVVQLYSRGEAVHIYKANNKGKLIGDYAASKVKEYNCYVDLEAATDRFYDELYKNKQENE